MDENEDNMIEKKVNYNYNIKNFLIKDTNILSNQDKYTSIFLCVYSVNTAGKYPFLQYLLVNNIYDSLSLPYLPLYSDLNTENMVTYAKLFLSGILLSDDFVKFNNSISFEGFYEFDNNLYLFFDATACDVNIDDTFSSSYARFGLIEEIINYKKICNFSIAAETTNVFLKNEPLWYLHDENGEAYEIPMIGFVGKSTENKLKFVHTFGESAKDKSEILGPYFYFTNFQSAIREGGWSHNYMEERLNNILITGNNGKYLKGGIVRFALFTGTIKYVENMPNDQIDESIIKKQRLQDNTLDHNREIQTLRISDHDGLWTNDYDSVYLGKVELDDGSILELDSTPLPTIVLKEYNQQVPLSYHFIDKKKLGYTFEPNNNNYGIV
jgi:hypothetical protein